MSLYDAFAPIYDDWSAHMTEDVAFYVELARETDGPLLELAVGSGRVAIPVARETGRHVLGIDSSPAMLAQARERAAAAGVDLELREGDMRDFELEEPAGLIYVPFRSSATCRPGPTAAASSSAPTPRSAPAAASPGTSSSSIRRSRPRTTASGSSTTGSATGSTTPSTTTGSTSRSRAAPRSRSGG